MSGEGGVRAGEDRAAWGAVRQQAVQHRRQGVDVAAGVSRVARKLLRAGIGRREAGGPCQPRAGFHHRDAEIEELRNTGRIDQDIARFEIPVDHAPTMRIRYRRADRVNQVNGRSIVEPVRQAVSASRGRPSTSSITI